MVCLYSIVNGVTDKEKKGGEKRRKVAWAALGGAGRIRGPR